VEGVRAEAAWAGGVQTAAVAPRVVVAMAAKRAVVDCNQLGGSAAAAAESSDSVERALADWAMEAVEGMVQGLVGESEVAREKVAQAAMAETVG